MLKNLERTQWVTTYQMNHTEVQSAEPSKEVLHRQHSESKRSLDEGREREIQLSRLQISQEANAARISGTKQLLDVYTSPVYQEEMEVNREKSLTEQCGGNLSTISGSSVTKEMAGIESNAKLSSRASSEQEMLAKGRELPGRTSNPCILPRPPVLPGRVGIVGKEGGAICLRDLQNKFSKSKAHRDFNCSITPAAVNLRDNVVKGKKHDFYGINCFYLHG
ncbi:hypothetical protein EYF80_011425 [Liparis tanakae]|uniref:Uncharacterized protein n=1 Tax=Liparis tanakae TaxID=230148 RepID=A0A4Z2IKY7_9TELE|nr:hypothetical protein EYF80_011425 [Liparis tanakae]